MEAAVCGRGPGAARDRSRRGAVGGGFGSAAELHDLLDALLASVDADERTGALVRAVGPRMRFEFTDLDLVLNLAGADGRGHNLRWRFDDGIDWEPRLRLWMDSATANRYLQGAESLAIGIAHRRVLCEGDARAALLYIPALRLLIEPYRRLVDERFPELAVRR